MYRNFAKKQKDKKKKKKDKDIKDFVLYPKKIRYKQFDNYDRDGYDTRTPGTSLPATFIESPSDTQIQGPSIGLNGTRREERQRRIGSLRKKTRIIRLKLRALYANVENLLSILEELENKMSEVKNYVYERSKEQITNNVNKGIEFKDSNIDNIIQRIEKFNLKSIEKLSVEEMQNINRQIEAIKTYCSFINKEMSNDLYLPIKNLIGKGVDRKTLIQLYNNIKRVIEIIKKLKNELK